MSDARDGGATVVAGCRAPGGKAARRRRAGLLVQIATLLTFALIPIGTVAVVQTQRAIGALRETYLDALRAETLAAATPEREAILGALGLARGLSDALAVLAPDGEACGKLMQRSAATNARALFVGLIEPPGMTECNNFGRRHDFSGSSAARAMFGQQQGDVRYSPAGEITGRPVVIVSEPVYTPDGSFRGFVSISLAARPLEPLVEDVDAAPERGPAVVLFSASGEILASNLSAGLSALLPADRPLAEFVRPEPFQFSVESKGGEIRDYAVVPIAPGRAYALGIGDADAARFGNRPALATTMGFPLAMWIVSLVVALISIHQLVIRPISDLGRRMRGFADGRRILHPRTAGGVPEEIGEIGETFDTMARKIVRDEADLENTLFERGVLLKEVHHRVKNNLQLMSSIINMQIRKVESVEARQALRDVQERLRSLATVHRGLYQAPEVSQVQFDQLLEELAGQLVAIAPERLPDGGPDFDLAAVRLAPDQAAPLAMLAAEILTNALKYVEPDRRGRRFIEVDLDCHGVEDADEITLRVTNSIPSDPGLIRPDGLGKKLIDVLVQQLAGTMTACAEDDHYRVEVRFLRDSSEIQPGSC